MWWLGAAFGGVGVMWFFVIVYELITMRKVIEELQQEIALMRKSRARLNEFR